MKATLENGSTFETIDTDNVVRSSSANIFTYAEPTDSYELDFDKVKTVEDCVLLLKCFICGFNKGYEPTIRIYNTSLMYEQMKHLAKEGE